MPLPSSVPKYERSLAREEVYTTLHEWIVGGILCPGEQMRYHELAVALGVSHTPIREALRRLEDEGLVETALNRWTRVSSVTVQDANDTYPLGAALEPLGIRLSAGRIGEPEIDVLSGANARLMHALVQGAPGEAERSDYDFHRTLIARCGNAELIRFMDELRVTLRRVGVAYFGGNLIAMRSVDEHAAIIDAVRANDYECAAQASEHHWKECHRRVLEQIGDST